MIRINKGEGIYFPNGYRPYRNGIRTDYFLANICKDHRYGIVDEWLFLKEFGVWL